MKISTRLRRIAARLPQGCKFADIGSDHGLLPIYAIKQNIATSAIAGEVNEGPLDAARRGVAGSGLQDRISVRKGNGLAVITSNEDVDTITIAGMGGALIASILSDGVDKLGGVKRLILQPNMAEEAVRRWLTQHNWLITDEIIIEEDSKIYEIITADRHEEASKLNEALYAPRTLKDGEDNIELTSSWLLELGPLLVETPNEVFFEKWNSEYKKLLRIYESILKSSQPEDDKALEFKQKAQKLEGILRCLQKVKP
ncbi:tRNA (adenine(22)-N(1))-methyltransferase [compost metagenome]